MLHCLAVVCVPPCENGVCVRNDTCSCSEGFSGNTCADQDVRECETNICENGGTCTVMGVSTVCTCPQGYTGLLCQESSMLYNERLVIIFYAFCVFYISECPPQCAMKYCSNKLTRRSLCTMCVRLHVKYLVHRRITCMINIMYGPSLNVWQELFRINQILCMIVPKLIAQTEVKMTSIEMVRKRC